MRILFVCTGNTCRSPMAEAIFNRLAQRGGLGWAAESAGIATVAGMPITDFAAEALEGVGIKGFWHMSVPFTAEHIAGFDMFAGMTPTHNYILEQAGVPFEKIYPFPREIMDPISGGKDTYTFCRDELWEQIEKLVAQIKQNESL